jgi:hypothetical protein
VTEGARPRVSVLHDPGVLYPEADDWFSPGERYPEYPFEHVARAPNRVYAMVRDLLVQAGLDRERFGTQAWNPLGGHVAPGATVFVLCNFVFHRRVQDSVETMQAKCIHGSVLRALLDYVWIAARPTGTVRFGNAPLQSCDWDRVLDETGARAVADFFASIGVPILPADLRLYVTRASLGRVVAVERREEAGRAVEIDLGRASLLAELDSGHAPRPRFRVTDYNPARTDAFHEGALHRYVIHRAVLESDTVISLPKMKTHEKVGITCGLKGFVGSVGHKDCLAHHRFGGPRDGGDEYSPRTSFLTPLSHWHEWLNRRDHDAVLQGPFRAAERLARIALRRAGIPLAGSWHGNDTAWRMALDLARILYFADRDGVLRETPQRRHVVLVDGIVAGEGNGPLAPRPVHAGTLVWSDDVATGDRVVARLMGFDSDRVPLVREAGRVLGARASDDPRLVVNGEERDEQELDPVLGRDFLPPRGWRGYVERGTRPGVAEVG